MKNLLLTGALLLAGMNAQALTANEARANFTATVTNAALPYAMKQIESASSNGQREVFIRMNQFNLDQIADAAYGLNKQGYVVESYLFKPKLLRVTW